MYGRHLGTFVRYVGDVLISLGDVNKCFGRPLVEVWETFRSRLGDIWRCLGDNWISLGDVHKILGDDIG